MEFKVFGKNLNVFNCVLCLTVGFLICLFTVCSCSKISLKEAFSSLSSAPLNYSMSGDVKDSWSNKALQYSGNMGYETVLQRFEGNKGTPVPLENTLDYFKNNAFKPECCPSTYSSSDGCACMSVDQVNYLNERGGNRTLSSEF
jgi:hypothetical protein